MGKVFLSNERTVKMHLLPSVPVHIPGGGGLLSSPLLRVVRRLMFLPGSRADDECPNIRDLLTRGLRPHEDPQ